MEYISSLVQRVSWSMHGDPPDPADAKLCPKSPEGSDVEYDWSEEDPPLTPAQWDTPVHPSGCWILTMRFDDRVMKDYEEYRAFRQRFGIGNSDYHVERRELFQPTATLREVSRPAGVWGQRWNARIA